MSQIVTLAPTASSLVLQCKNEESKILSFLNNGLMNEVCLTADKFHELMADMQNKFASLFELNQDLRHCLIASESRNREILLIHKSELDEMKKALELSKKEISTLRQEMIAAAAKADQLIAAEIANKDQAVKAAIQTGDARVLASQQETLAVKSQISSLQKEMETKIASINAEKGLSLQTEKNKYDAAIAAAKQETETVRTQLTTQVDLQKKLTNLAYLEGQDNCKMMEFYYEFLITNSHYIARRSINDTLQDNYFSEISNFKNLLTERLIRPIDSAANIPLQNSDTQKMKQLESKIMQRHNWIISLYPDGSATQGENTRLVPTKNLLLPLINARNTRPR